MIIPIKKGIITELFIEGMRLFIELGIDLINKKLKKYF